MPAGLHSFHGADGTERVKHAPPPADLADTVSRYYAARLRAHGTTPQGVDWNGAASQEQRFRQFLRLEGLIDASRIVDLGCGYGALLRFLRQAGYRGHYHGVDLAPEMIAAASAFNAADPLARFEAGAEPSEDADFVVASGIFSVRVDVPDATWEDHMRATMRMMASHARHGIAFNCLTLYSDVDRRRPHLYYADPLAWFDWAKRQIAPSIALLHDYGLYEFTILIDKRAPPGAAGPLP